MKEGARTSQRSGGLVLSEREAAGGCPTPSRRRNGRGDYLVFAIQAFAALLTPPRAPSHPVPSIRASISSSGPAPRAPRSPGGSWPPSTKRWFFLLHRRRERSATQRRRTTPESPRDATANPDLSNQERSSPQRSSPPLAGFRCLQTSIWDLTNRWVRWCVSVQRERAPPPSEPAKQRPRAPSFLSLSLVKAGDGAPTLARARPPSPAAVCGDLLPAGRQLLQRPLHVGRRRRALDADAALGALCKPRHQPRLGAGRLAHEDGQQGVGALDVRVGGEHELAACSRVGLGLSAGGGGRGRLFWRERGGGGGGSGAASRRVCERTPPGLFLAPLS